MTRCIAEKSKRNALTSASSRALANTPPRSDTRTRSAHRVSPISCVSASAMRSRSCSASDSCSSARCSPYWYEARFAGLAERASFCEFLSSCRSTQTRAFIIMRQRSENLTEMRPAVPSRLLSSRHWDRAVQVTVHSSHIPSALSKWHGKTWICSSASVREINEVTFYSTTVARSCYQRAFVTLHDTEIQNYENTRSIAKAA